LSQTKKGKPFSFPFYILQIMVFIF